MKNPWKTLSQKIVHKNKWFSIRKDKVIRPDGKSGEYNVMLNGSGVYVVAVSKDDKVCLIKLYRYATNMGSVEIPAGSCDGDSALAAAKRELLEETGYKAKIWKQIGKFQEFNGYCDRVSTVFLARDLVQYNPSAQLEEGIVEVLEVPFKIALDMVAHGKISASGSIVALHYAEKFLGR